MTSPLYPSSPSSTLLTGFSAATENILNRLGRAANRVTGELPAVMAAPPTFTAGVANAPATLPLNFPSASGYNNTFVQPNYAYIGVPRQQANYYPYFNAICNTSVNFGTSVGSFLSGAGWSISFMTDAPLIEVVSAGHSGANDYCILIDGQRLNLNTQSSNSTAGAVYNDLIAFGSRKRRQITLVGNLYFFFCGINVDAASRVWAANNSPDRVFAVVMGDSYTEDSVPDYPDGTWARGLSYLLGWNVQPSGVGGTGYLNTNGGASMTFRERFAADVSVYNPDVIVIAGGINDGGSSQSAIGTEASLLYAQAISENQNSIIFVLGPWSGKSSPTPSYVETALFAAAQAQPQFGTSLFYVPTLTAVPPFQDSLNAGTYIAADPHPGQAGHDYLAGRVANSIRGLIPTLPSA